MPLKIPTSTFLLIGCPVALAVYLGLRESREPALAALPDDRPNISQINQSTAKSPGPEEQERIAQAVLASLTRAKPRLTEKCWDPSHAQAKEPARVKLTWNGTIGPSGRAAAFGLAEDREASRPDIMDCVQRELQGISVDPPPRAMTQVSVDFVLP
jgi:hypothetical protein